MTNIVTHQTGTGEPHASNHGLAAGELAIKQKATAHTTAASGKLYYGEDVSDLDSTTSTLRTFGIGILAGDDSDQSQTGVPIGGNMYFKEGNNMTIAQSTSGDVVTLTFTPSTSATLTGAGSTIDSEDLTASRALVSNGSGKVAVSAVTATELGYLDGVTSAIQTQLDATVSTSSANVFTAAQKINDDLTLTFGTNDDVTMEYDENGTDTLLITGAVQFADGSTNVNFASHDGTNGLALGGTVVTASAAELNYVDGVTSAIQTQLDAKQASLTFGKSSGNALKSEEALATNDILLMGSSNVKGRTYSQLKADLSLEIGTDVQAYDAQLDTLAAMTSGEINAFAALSATEIGIIDGLTATTAEINYLDNDDLTAADLTKLAALTASAAEINILDGVTGVTAAELSYIGDVTSAIQSQLDNKVTGTLSLGSTDNAILRANGTGGTSAQGSSLVIDDSANLTGANGITGATITASTKLVSDKLEAQNHGGSVMGIEFTDGFGSDDTIQISVGNAVRFAFVENGDTRAFIPWNDNDVNLGHSSYEFKNLYIDGTAYLDAIQLGSTAISSTGAELNLVDGSSAGTIVNSKAVIYGSSGEVNATTLQIAGTSISATAAELNIMDGVTATAAELNIMDGVTATAAEINLIDGGTARGTTAVASGDGFLHNDGGTMRMTNISSLATRLAGTNLTASDGVLSASGGGSSLTVGSDNQIPVTNSGGDDLEYSSNFTYDGTDLSITTSGNSTVLKLISTDSDGNDAPMLDIIRDSSSPSDGDELGRIRFIGETSSGGSKVYGGVFGEIVDQTNGSVDGLLTFEACINNTSTEIVKCGAHTTSSSQGFWPKDDNTVDLGIATDAWKHVYAKAYSGFDGSNFNASASSVDPTFGSPTAVAFEAKIGPTDFDVNLAASGGIVSLFDVTPQSSDERFKENLQDYTKGLSFIIGLPTPQTYDWKSNVSEIGRTPTKGDLGYVAQTLESYYPDVVVDIDGTNYGCDDFKQVNYKKLERDTTYALINAVKELKTKNDALEARIAALEG